MTIDSDFIDSDFETRVSDALDAGAAQVAPSAPPTFSWQAPAAVHRSRSTLRTTLKVALPVAAAAVAAVALIPGGTSPDHHRATAPVRAPGRPAVQVALLQPGGTAPMSAGQFFYRKSVAAEPNGTRTVIETWQPQHQSGVWTLKTFRQHADGSRAGAVTVETARCGAFPGPVVVAHAHCAAAGTWLDPTPTFLAGLPTDPKALYNKLFAYVVADYKTTAKDRKIDLSTRNLAFLTINYISFIGDAANGLSAPFSKALQGATALVPGVVVKPHARNLTGVTGTSYEIDYAPGNVAGPILFDADGNYIGRSTTAVSVGAADRAGTAPVTATH